MRIFLDANILFSAACTAGAVRRLLALASNAGHVLCADAYVLAEARRNVAMKAPHGVDALEAIVGRLSVCLHAPPGLSPGTAPQLDPKDRPVLAAAIGMRCDVLVTGDVTHFGRYFDATLEGVTVRSPRSLASALGFAAPTRASPNPR
jgi:predicted nucleic acid-binding protein